MAQSLSENQDVSPEKRSNEPLSGKTPAAQRARITDWLFRNITFLFALSSVVFIVGIALTLFIASQPNFAHSGGQFFSATGVKLPDNENVYWDPVAPDPSKRIGDLYRVLPFVYGTLITSLLALLIAVPIGLGAAIFLSEIAPRWLSTPLSFVIEMLAAVPSIVYGFWALIYLVPRLQSGVETWLGANFGQIPFFAKAPDGGSGLDFLAAGLILALMVLPFITAVSRDVLRTVPDAQREAAYGMGATRWEAIRSVVVRYASSGIIGAIMLGLGRALGETMAVTLVIGSKLNVFPRFGDASSFSLFRPGYTMTSVLADQYPSPNSPIHIAALTEVALTLFIVTIIVNGLARGLVWLTAMRAGGGAESDLTRHAKLFTGGVLRWGIIGFIALIFLYQTYRDVVAHGFLGLFGAAELIGYAVLAIALFSIWVPGKPIFLRWRLFSNGFALFVCGLCTLIGCAALAVLFFYVIHEGISSLNGAFFRPPNPDNPDAGGMLHAIVGTGEFIVMASLMGVPLGVMGGIFLSEFGNSRVGACIRFATDLLNGVPSIVLGIFAYTLIIVPTHSNFGLAGGFALGVMMIPVIMRTTEELVRLVPQALREGSLALGATYARTMWKIVLPSARGGIVTGILLAIARIAGETAPLLMVGCNSSLWNTDPRQQLASLPVQIYVLRDAPTKTALQQSWGVALVLVIIVLVLNLIARLLTRSKQYAAH